MHAFLCNVPRALRGFAVTAAALAIFRVTGFAANYVLRDVVPSNARLP